MFGMTRSNLVLETGGGRFDQIRSRLGAVFSMVRSGNAVAQLSCEGDLWLLFWISINWGQ